VVDAKIRQIRTLIVDDEEDIRLLIRMVIQNAGNDLTVAGEAADGREALEIFASGDIDVVIIDQRMPGLSGLETAREMLLLRPLQKIVMCSAFLDTDLRREAEGAGIAVSIAKGEIDRLPEVVRELVSSPT
jgi:YesN/AraC family two-component response regulator